MQVRYFFFSPVKLNENSVHYQSNGSFWLLLSKQICSKVIYFFTEKSCTNIMKKHKQGSDVFQMHLLANLHQRVGGASSLYLCCWRLCGRIRCCADGQVFTLASFSKQYWPRFRNENMHITFFCIKIEVS